MNGERSCSGHDLASQAFRTGMLSNPERETGHNILREGDPEEGCCPPAPAPRGRDCNEVTRKELKQEEDLRTQGTKSKSCRLSVTRQRGPEGREKFSGVARDQSRENFRFQSDTNLEVFVSVCSVVSPASQLSLHGKKKENTPAFPQHLVGDTGISFSHEQRLTECVLSAGHCS